VQQERLNAQQSLFGSAGVADIQPPAVPVVEDWNQLQLLNKEREVIGLYLSSHPLDEYKVIIKHMCKVGASSLDDLEPLNGQEVALAGVVTSVQNLTTKTGRQFGKFILEDYDGGSHEFALFGKDYEKFRQYLYPNYFLFIRGKVQPKPFGDNPELEFKIQSMMQLEEVRDNMIKEVHITVPIEDITERFVEEFSTKIIGTQSGRGKNSKGKAVLRLAVTDKALGVTLNMYSRKYKVELTNELIEYLEDMELKHTLS
jgi:DNA polymerase-3 subunit alpha